MTPTSSADVPVFACHTLDEVVHVVISIAMFRAEPGGAQEAAVPAVELALDRARLLARTERLVAGRVGPMSAERLVARVELAVKKASDEGAVLWLRVVDEQFARAALAAMRSIHDVTVVPSQPQEPMH